jgi:hypothetical protein
MAEMTLFSQATVQLDVSLLELAGHCVEVAAGLRVQNRLDSLPSGHVVARIPPPSSNA